MFPIPELAKDLSIFRISPVRQRLQSRYKPRDFLLPVVKCRSRSNNKEGAPDIVRFRKVRHDRDGLDCFPKTHFVCENTVDTLLVKIHQPIETLELIFFQLTIQHLRLRDLLNIGHASRIREVKIFGINVDVFHVNITNWSRSGCWFRIRSSRQIEIFRLILGKLDGILCTPCCSCP